MNYIYDVLANLNKDYFEFYEWNENDEIIHIKKLPILRVSSEFLKDAKENRISISKQLLEKIHKKADFFKGFKVLDYICALTDTREAIIINLDNKGNILEKSSFLIDEENEVVDISNKISLCEYDYSIIDKCKCDSFKTRKEIYISNYIMDELKNINDDKLKYLYFECFNINLDDTKVIFDNVLNEINTNFFNTYDKIYNFLKLTSINK